MGSIRLKPLRAPGERLPTILYVGSYGRSGSTLVGRVLGEAPDTVCVGETRYLWSRGLLSNVECGCGKPFRECSFWQAVGDDAFGGWDRVDTQRVAEIDRILAPLRVLPLHWAPSLRPRFAAMIDEYVNYLTRLYIAIARVTGASLIVDSSKEPHFASLLARIPGSDVRVIHLVRDSRAVAYSWTRNKRLPTPIGDQNFMPRFKPTDTAPKWAAWNTAFHVLGTKRLPSLRINYETFIADPRGALRELSDFAGHDLLLPPSQLNGNKIHLGGHHMFSGNPMRANMGWLDMKLDDEWQTMQPTSQFASVTAVTWPLLRLYGYRTIPAARRP